jgi:hypothetical protein
MAMVIYHIRTGKLRRVSQPDAGCVKKEYNEVR